jgi:trk system potassium uptake protein TrkA
VAYLTRFGEGMLPRADTSYQQGDTVHVMLNVADNSEISHVLASAPAKESE